MAIDWTKPVVTADGVEPLLSPPNNNGDRCGWVDDALFIFKETGNAFIPHNWLPAPELNLRNKPEKVKVWLKLGRSGDGLIRGTVSPYGSIGYLGNEWLHGPIEIPIPEGK